METMVLGLRAVMDANSGKRIAAWIDLSGHPCAPLASAELFVDGSPLDPPIILSTENYR